MVTLALIGAGKWGQNYLHAVSALKNIRIKYICAQTQQTLDTLPNIYCKTLSIKELLKNRDIDGYIIATPESTHFPLAKQLLTHGQNLLIEKPLATHYKDAKKLQKIWQAKKTKVLIGHLYLYNPAYQLFKKLFKKMKKIKSISFEGTSSPVRNVSVVWDWGPHPVSILLDLINQLPIEVRAHGSRHTVNAIIKFNSNIKASVHISWKGERKVRRLFAENDEETIELDDTKTSNKVLVSKPNKPTLSPKYKPVAPLVEELMEFTQAIKNHKKITSDINMGISVIKVLSAIEQSVKNKGKLIKIS